MAGAGTPSRALAVDEVGDRRSFRRFLALPYRLHDRHPLWGAPLIAAERRRLTPSANPFFDAGDAAYFVARRGRDDIGRITAHVAGDGAPGHFGFFEVDVDGEPDGGAEATAALLQACERWLRSKGCSTLSGPRAFVDEDEAGVLVAGYDQRGMTTRPWTPPAYAALLEAAGWTTWDDEATYALDVDQLSALDTPAGAGDAGPAVLADGDRLELQVEGAGTIIATPDVAGALRDAGLVSAWSLARRARTRRWERAVVVRVDGAADVLVPALAAELARAGYRALASPWAPDARPPVMVHRTYTRPLT